jgi:outer membrane protein
MNRNRCLVIVAGLVLLLSAAPVWAQSSSSDAPQSQGQAPATPATPATPADQIRHLGLLQYDFSSGQHGLPNPFKVYTAYPVPAQSQENAADINQFVKEGNLMLSLDEAIELALQNNQDISVQRWVTYQADAGVLQAKAGPVLPTPTGTFVSFDPTITLNAGWERISTPVGNPFTSGTGQSSTFTLNQQFTVADFGYSQAFPTGTAYSVSLNNERSSENSPGNIFQPQVTSSMTVAVNQPLLSGFGFTPNLRFLRVARNNRKFAQLAFEQQVITSVVAVMDDYYELVFALQDVEVKKKTLALNEKLLNDNKRQVEIGTLAPIEVTRAAAQVASAEGDLINSQTLALQDETVLKNVIFRDVMDPHISQLSIVTSDKPDENMAVPDIPLEKAVAEATASRPDVKQALVNLDSSKIVVKATHNQLLPSLSVSAQYGTQGLSGNQCVEGTGATAMTCSPPPPPVPAGGRIVAGGLYNSLAQTFQSDYPNYAAFMSLSIPLRNRFNQAANINAKLQERQQEASLQRTRNTVAVDVRNALIQLAQSKAAVEADIKARILAEQTLDAEQKKFLLGASTTFVVVQTERDLATARSAEVRAMANLAEAKVNFDRALGRTLQVNRIDVADAHHSGPGLIPLIPGTPTKPAEDASRVTRAQ